MLPESLAVLDRYQSLVTRDEDAEALVRIAEDEDPGRFPAEETWHDFVRLYRTGLHPAIGLCVRHRGRVVLHRTIGHTLNHPDEAHVGDVATPDTLFSLFSASKIVTAMVVHALIEDGVLHLEERMADTIPELATRGKEAIRLRHLLNHTAGIPDMPRDFDVQSALGAGRIDVSTLESLRPSHEPGVNVAYHPMTSWIIVQELIERKTGKDLRHHLRSRFLDPMGLSHLNYGVADGDLGAVARHAVTGLPVPGFMGRIFERTIGTDLHHAIRLSNEESFLTGVLPSANVIGSPGEMTAFMQMLLDGGKAHGVRVLSPETVHRATTDITRAQFDSTFGFPMRYGLGMMMGGNRFSLFGLGTRGAFGHLGLSAVVVYADPRRKLAVSFLNTGKTMAAPGMVQWAWCVQRILQAAAQAGKA